MKLLLDTHAFLWFISGDSRLPAEIGDLIGDMQNDVYLSVASVWEAIIKQQLNKLPLPESAATYLPKCRRQHFIQSLFVDEASVARLAELPDLHRDPFDRIIISQALQHGLTIVTSDAVMRAYAVPLIPQEE